MKIMKKMLSVVLALSVIMAFSITSFAATDDGTITVSNATNGATYTAYKVFDAEKSDNGKSILYKYEGDVPENLQYFSVDDNGYVTINDDGKMTDGSLTKDAITELQKFDNENKGTAVGEKETAVIKNLPYGYYIVTSSVKSEGDVSAISVTTVAKDATIRDKNGIPSWDNGDNPGDPGPGKVIIEKDADNQEVKVDENTVNIGDSVQFSIAINATQQFGDEYVTHYWIKDTLEAGKWTNAHDFVVTVLRADGVKVTLDANEDYKIKQDGNVFEVDVPYYEEYGALSVIDVRYKAELKETCDIAGDGNLNTAVFGVEYQPTKPSEDPKVKDPKEPSKKFDEQKTTTYTYAIALLKTDENKAPLAGAKFTVDGVKAKATSTPGVYVYDATTGVEEFSTDDQGMLVIKGLKQGEYTLTETVAPKGYNILTDPVSINTGDVPSEGTTFVTSVTKYFDKDGNLIETKVDENTTTFEFKFTAPTTYIEVINQAGPELPSTGGIGTTIFYILGIILVLGAAVLLITRRRMDAR